MKKLLVFIIAFSSLGLTAQTMAFSAVEVRMKDHTEKDVLEAFDKVMKGVKPNKGGVVLERIWYNSPAKGMTHRMVWLYTLGEDLFDDESIDEDKNEAFWAKMGNYVEDWGTSYSGRMLSWKEGDTEKYPRVHIWDIKITDRNRFKKAHDQIVKEFSSEFKDRLVAFGTYDIGKPNGASHWVALTGKDQADHMLLYDNLEKSSRFLKLISERGPVENIKDFQAQILRRIQ